MTVSDNKPDKLPPRLCNEIQLFDLCERESCNFKNGRFCADPAMLRRFETISDKDEASERYVPEESTVAGEEDGDCYDEEQFSEYCEGGEDDDWEDEDQ